MGLKLLALKQMFCDLQRPLFSNRQPPQGMEAALPIGYMGPATFNKWRVDSIVWLFGLGVGYNNHGMALLEAAVC